uniref:Uncharacterized protein n=1 Tax=Strigamia maritima TaxID=126957 RepID=T1IWD0_STRMM
MKYYRINDSQDDDEEEEEAEIPSATTSEHEFNYRDFVRSTIDFYASLISKSQFKNGASSY